jgi:RNA polymerase sigma-70 factor (ECF subfamily)
MPARESFVELLGRLEAGDEAAAREVFNRFAVRLTGLARARLHPRIRQKIDAEDVVQSVFRSFFTRQAHGQFQFDDWDGVWSVLVIIALRKCGRHAETLHAACRDIRREVRAAGAVAAGGDAWDAVTRDPTPDEVVSLAETIEQLMHGLDETEQAILAFRLQGFTNLEIAEKVGTISERKVYRVLAQVRKRLERLLGSQD